MFALSFIKVVIINHTNPSSSPSSAATVLGSCWLRVLLLKMASLDMTLAAKDDLANPNRAMHASDRMEPA